MTVYVTDAAGICWQLPQPRSWECEFGIGTPCDSFVAQFPWEMGMDHQSRSWVKFHAQHEGRRVFTGLVDECEMTMDGEGCGLELSGRGMAALLLDNEALGQDYQVATPKDILRGHVAPYGIAWTGGETLPHVSRFRVETGSSEWTVLEGFLRACGDEIRPRFDPWGRLILAPWEEKEPVRIDDSTPVSGVRRRERRYGVVSEILVRDRYSGRVERVEQQEFTALGGRARRVLTMPGKSNAAAMERAGQEQLRRAFRGWEELEVTLPIPFAAMPGDLVELGPAGWRDRGLYRVSRCASGMDTRGYWSRLTLGRPDQV